VHEEQAVRERVLRVRLAADPASVPGARRFVADGLRSWGRADLVDDASLCVSELAGNAALHGNGTFIQVSVLDLDRVVRVCVEDDGAGAAEVVPRAALPTPDPEDDLTTPELEDLELMLAESTTGRGLAIVSVLARDWGVDDLGTGKRVWADLAPSGDDVATAGETVHTALPQTDDDVLPDGWVVIRLAACPVELSLQQDQHLDELVRELTLIRSNHENTEALALAHRLEAILRTPAQARAAGRRQAQAALARGEHHVDVEMAMPREFCPEVLELQAAVKAADVLCEQQRLLTLTSSQELRDFRAWMTEEIVAQAERDATPRPWGEWLAERAGRP
jgi:anti-sigma regulatory factor (Ser/Thr protein kinase)